MKNYNSEFGYIMDKLNDDMEDIESNRNKLAISRLGFLNVLRFVAAICIAVFLHWNDHLIPNLGLENPYENNIIFYYISKKSYIFVEMFFLISGMLFYLKSLINIRNDKTKFSSFLGKKLARLLPVTTASTLFMFLADYFLYFKTKTLWTAGTLSVGELFLNIVFGGKSINSPSYNGTLWYIGVLIICYVIAYWLAKASKKAGNKIFLIPILFAYLYMSERYSLCRGLFGFFVGIYLGKFLAIFTSFNNKKKIITSIISLTFVLLSFISILVSSFYNKNIYDMMYFDQIISYSIMIFVPLIIFLYTMPQADKVFSSKIFGFLGKISYGIYVWNFPILITVHILIKVFNYSIDIAAWYFFIILFIVHIIVATISYVTIELPVSKKIKKVLEMTILFFE